MDLNVKLVGTFAKFLPDDAKDGITKVSVDADTNVSQLVDMLNIPPGKPCMISINDQLVSSSERGTRCLQPSDEIKVIPPLKGG